MREEGDDETRWELQVGSPFSYYISYEAGSYTVNIGRMIQGCWATEFP
jgi:hypothetical protein